MAVVIVTSLSRFLDPASNASSRSFIPTVGQGFSSHCGVGRLVALVLAHELEREVVDRAQLVTTYGGRGRVQQRLGDCAFRVPRNVAA
jgi:hypothetical protein